MANTSIGTAWIQIKPTLKGIKNDIQGQLESEGNSAGSSFNKGFSNSFLAASKATFASAFSDFGARSEAAFSQFKVAASVGFAIATAGVISFAKQLDGASGSQQSFITNMQLAGYANEETAATFKLLQDYANKSIYSLTDMTSTAGVLASTGVKNAGELVRAFGNLASAADNPSQAIQSMSQQMSQVNGKGFVQTMDFRIMQEQAAGPMKLVRDQLMALNKWNPSQFIDALSNGEISASMLNDAMLSVGNNPMLYELATKPRTISDAWEALTSTIVSNLSTSESWARVQQKVINLLSKAGDWVANNQDAISEWIDTIVNATESTFKWVKDNQELVTTLLTAVVAFKALQIATGGVLSIIKTMTPYVNIVKGAIFGVIGLTQKLLGLGSASKVASDVAGGMDKMTQAANKAPKTFAFGESIASFFKNIGQTLTGAVNAVMEPLKALLSGIGQAIAGFFKAFSSPQLLVGILIFTAAAAAVALAILMIGAAIGTIAPSLGDFLNLVIIPLGTFLMTVLVVALAAVTTAIIRLTTDAVIPLVNAVSGGLVAAFGAIGGVIGTAGIAISRVIDSISGGIANVINSIANLLRSVGGQDWYGTGYGITRNFSAGLIDGLIDLMQDSLNKIINNVINIPGIGDALKSVGVKADPVNLKSFKLGRRAMGGPVFGPGSGTSDSIPMAISNGEYVIKAAAAQKIGYANLDAINSTGEVNGGGFTMGDIIINGYEKDKKELADEISKIIARNRKRVLS